MACPSTISHLYEIVTVYSRVHDEVLTTLDRAARIKVFTLTGLARDSPQKHFAGGKIFLMTALLGRTSADPDSTSRMAGEQSKESRLCIPAYRSARRKARPTVKLTTVK